MYEIYEKLLKIKGIKSSDVSKTTGISNMTFSDWKNGKSTPKPDKLALIADYFEVTIDFLMGRTDMIVCPECEISYNPLDEESNFKHQQLHVAYERAIIKYGICFSLEDCREIDQNSINSLVGSSASPLTAKDLEYNYTNHLKAGFSYLLRKNNFELEYESFDEYAREQIIKDKHQNFMSKDLFELLIKKYDVDLSYVDEHAEILSRASKNAQLMRLLAYAEKLTPQLLDTIEIQLKALAEQNTKE